MSTIYSPVVSGSGVSVVHQAIERRIPGYELNLLSPRATLFPPAMLRYRKPAPIVHAIPDTGLWPVHKESKLILTFHGFYLDSWVLRHATMARKIYYLTLLRQNIVSALQKAHRVVAVSDFIADLVMSHLSFKKIEVIKNGVDTVLFHPSPRIDDGIVKILFVGNPTHLKGVSVLQDMADALPANCQLFATTGIRKGVVKIDSDRIVAVPPRPHHEMAQLYQSMDLLFFPTLREGLSLAVAEAMACGLPVIATNCASLPEQVLHGRGGFLFEPHDLEQARNYILKVANDRSIRHEMGQFNRERAVSLFDVDRMARQYEALFNSENA